MDRANDNKFCAMQKVEICRRADFCPADFCPAADFLTRRSGVILPVYFLMNLDGQKPRPSVRFSRQTDRSHTQKSAAHQFSPRVEWECLKPADFQNLPLSLVRGLKAKASRSARLKKKIGFSPPPYYHPACPATAENACFAQDPPLPFHLSQHGMENQPRSRHQLARSLLSLVRGRIVELYLTTSQVTSSQLYIDYLLV